MKKRLPILLALLLMLTCAFSAFAAPTGEYYYYTKLSMHSLLFQIDTGWQDMLLDGRIAFYVDEDSDYGAMMFRYVEDGADVPLFAVSVRLRDTEYAPADFDNVTWSKEHEGYVIELFTQAQAGGHAYDTAIESLANIENIVHFVTRDESWDFTVVDMNDQTMNAKDVFWGSRLTMVNAWATYCGPCLQELPDIGKLAKDYAEKGVSIVGVVTDVYEGQDAAYAKSLIDETGADYRHLYINGDLSELLFYDMQYVPTTYMLDDTGRVIYKYVGSMDYAGWAQLLEELLAE